MRRLHQNNDEVFELQTKVLGKKDAFNWVNPVMVGGWFLGIICISMYYKTTFISFTGIAKIYLISAMILFAIPYKMAVKKILIRYAHWNIFCFIGIAPVLTALAFVLNFHFSYNPQHATYTRLYRVFDGKLQVKWFLEPQLNNAPPNLKSKLIGLNDTRDSIHIVDFSLSQGFLGFPVISNCYFYK